MRVARAPSVPRPRARPTVPDLFDVWQRQLGQPHNAPTNCPPQYTRRLESESTTTYTCDYSGAVSVTVNGTPFARTWWSLAGDTVTEFSPAAKTALGSWDTRFDDDHAAWLAAHPTDVPTTPGP
jgi:hypothetical protein